jgi:hypothetical protein
MPTITMPTDVTTPRTVVAWLEREWAVGPIETLLAAVRAGCSETVVLRGEAEIGAASTHLDKAASGFRIIRVVAAESQREIPFAALHSLCARMLDRVERLPNSQRAALRSAFTPNGDGCPDRLLVGAAVFDLLCHAADEQPLICVIEDAQWLDPASAQALSVVAGRQAMEPVGTVFTVRAPDDDFAVDPAACRELCTAAALASRQDVALDAVA